MSNYVRSEEYQEIGQMVIESVEELQYLKTADCRIVFMASDAKKSRNGRKTLGECIKVNDLYRDFCPYDFMIVFYERNIEGLTEEQLAVLAEHELLHVGVEEKENGDVRYYCRPHDYADFKQITDKYGTDWADDGMNP